MIRNKVNLITSGILLATVIVAYYAFEHVGVYLIEKPDSGVFATISTITSIMLMPGFYIHILLGGSIHAGINNLYEILVLIIGSWFVWTALVICLICLAKTIREKFLYK